MKVSVSGGPSVIISQTDVVVRGVSWSAQGIVFPKEIGSGLFHLPADGDSPTPLTVLDANRNEMSHRFPEFLPGGETVLFTVSRSDTQSWDDAGIAVALLRTGEHAVVLEGGSLARYSPTGHLIYLRAGSLLAVPFDLAELRATGRPVPVVEGVSTPISGGHAHFSLAKNGSLVYAPGAPTRGRRVLWIDRQGRSEPVIEEPRSFGAPRLSPDGQQVALMINSANLSLWIFDLTRSTLTRVTSDWNHALPVWSPNGRELIWASDRSGVFNLYRRLVDSSAEPERLTTSEIDHLPRSWSSDGAFLTLSEFSPDTGVDVLYLSLADDAEPMPILTTPSNEDWPMFSPNGEWLAYQSDESGRNEFYVRRFPGGRSKQLVSTEGGTLPRWNPDGQELFYRNGDKMMSVAVQSEGELVLGKPTLLFEKRFFSDLFTTINVTPDGQRFLYLDDSAAEPPPTELVLIQNFSEELKRLVPAEN